MFSHALFWAASTRPGYPQNGEDTMMRTTSTATVASLVAAIALAAAAAGCSSSSESPAPSSAELPSVSTGKSTPSNPEAPSEQPTKIITIQPTGQPAPTKPATNPPATNPQGPNNGGSYDVPCTGGPDQGTICTNPNHGAGDDPYGTGTPKPKPTTTKPH